MTERKCDVAILGAGTAGLTAEAKARKAGARTLIIDPEFAGTTCATVGCMPSKLMIAAADKVRAMQDASDFGIDAQPARVVSSEVLNRIRRERDRFVSGVLEKIEEIPAENRLRDRATFASENELRLEGGDTIRTKATVIATGSAPVVPNDLASLGNLLLTNETLFELETLPRSVAVIGAGSIGIEMAQALAALGVEVALFDRDRVSGGISDRQIIETLCYVLAKDMDLHLGVEVVAVRDEDRVELRWDGKQRVFDRVLATTGRRPNVDGLSPEAAGLEIDDNGIPLFDKNTLQCGNAAVFIAGDANADRPVLHEASAEGVIAGLNAAAFPDCMEGRRKTALSITFSRPEVCKIGKTEAKDLFQARASWEDQGRAKVEGRNQGSALLFCEPDGTLVGAEVCAPEGEFLAHLLAWIIQSRLTANQALDLPFYHPTLIEGLRPAFKKLCAETEANSSWDQDDADRPGQ